jgi:hypothetical protein
MGRPSLQHTPDDPDWVGARVSPLSLIGRSKPPIKLQCHREKRSAANVENASTARKSPRDAVNLFC